MGSRVPLWRLVVCALKGHNPSHFSGTFYVQCTRCWRTWNLRYGRNQ